MEEKVHYRKTHFDNSFICGIGIFSDCWSSSAMRSSRTYTRIKKVVTCKNCKRILKKQGG